MRHIGAKWKMHRSCYERGFESRDVRPRSAVLCGVRAHGKADCNQRNPGGARLLPKGLFRYTGMRLACLRSSVRRRQAAVVIWGAEFCGRDKTTAGSPGSCPDDSRVKLIATSS